MTGKADGFQLELKSRSTTKMDSEYVPTTTTRMSFRSSIVSRRFSEKPVLPRISIAHKDSLDTFNRVRFQVDKKEDGNDPSLRNVRYFPSKHFQIPQSTVSLGAVRRSLNMKDIFNNEVLLSAIPSDSSIDTKTHFTGNLWIAGSSCYTESGIPTFDLRFDESRFAGLGGEGSVIGLPEETWPWPWLSVFHSSTEYITKSEPPVSFQQQGRLLNFPILPLGQVLHTYLESLRPFLRSGQLSEINKFFDSLAVDKEKMFYDYLTKEVGESLTQDDGILSVTGEIDSHHSLAFRSSSTRLCLSRLEAPLTNFGIIAPFVWDLWPEHRDSQLDRAVMLIEMVAEFFRLVYSQRLAVFYDEKGYLLCNHQFRKLFSSTQIPGIPSDATASFFKTLNEKDHRATPNHIVVICRGRMFSLQVLMENNKTVPTEELRVKLMQILELSKSESADKTRTGVGVLTALNRNDWAEARVYVMELSSNNCACLEQLERAMFVISLDHKNVRGPERLTSESLFADGCNRWYDKALSFYIYNNGLITVNVCSAVIDGSTVNALIRFIHLRIVEDAEKWDDEVLKNPVVSRCVSSEAVQRALSALSQISCLALMPDSDSDLPQAYVASDDSRDLIPLDFDVDTELGEAIDDARNAFTQMEESFSSSICHFIDFRSGFFASKKISVDAFAHLALQLNFFKMYFRPAAVGSKVSIKRFYHACYDTMPTTTTESVSWCRAMLDPSSSHSERLALFHKAAKVHCERLEDVRSGKSCYQHVAALKRMLENARETHFSDILDEVVMLPAGSPDRMDILCESLYPYNSLAVPVLAPPTQFSYGVGYAIGENKALFTVTSWRQNQGTCAKLFACSLHRCLGELRTLLSPVGAE